MTRLWRQMLIERDSPWLAFVVGVDEFSAAQMTLRVFRQHLQATNDPAYRYLAIYHRAPLFFPNGNLMQKMFAAHWSPLMGYDETNDLVLVGDVNEKYGTWLTSSANMFSGIANRSFIDGGEWRGLLRVRLSGKSPRTIVTALPEDLVSSFCERSSIVGDVRSFYYHLADKTKCSYYQQFVGTSKNGALTSRSADGVTAFRFDTEV
jgi:hypothetical protein